MMTTDTVTQEEVTRVGALLQEALGRCLNGVGGAHARPSHTAKRLGLDTTLVWRIVRAVRAPSPIGCVHRLPSPSGIAEFRSAIQSLPEVDGRELDGAMRAFESLIDLFPSGRRGLNAAIEGWLPEARHAGLRTAAQDAFRAYSHLVGCQIDAHAIGTIVVPPAEGASADVLCDTLHVRVLDRIRRLRDGAPVALCSTARPTLDHSVSACGVSPVRRSHDASDIRDLLLSTIGMKPHEFSAHAVGGASVLTLPVGSPAVNESATIALASRAYGTWRAYRSREQETETGSYRYSVPCRASVNDLIVPQSLRSAGIPELLLHMQGTSTGDPMTDREAFELTRLPIPVSSSSGIALDASLSALEWNETPAYAESLRTAFAESGLDPRDFVAFRVRLDWPPPFVTLTWFYSLAEGPPGNSSYYI